MDAIERLAHDAADAAAAFDRALDEVATGKSWLRSIRTELDTLVSNPPPAPALTEDAIVAALKADPAMAAEILVTLGFTMERTWRLVVRDRAQFCCQHAAKPELLAGLQSLAVALAAASYRG